MTRDEEAQETTAQPGDHPADGSSATPTPVTTPPALSRRIPPPEVLDDWEWSDQQMRVGAFDAYRGEHIAIVGKQLVGHDRDPHALLDRVARALQVPLRRVVIRYVGDGT